MSNEPKQPETLLLQSDVEPNVIEFKVGEFIETPIITLRGDGDIFVKKAPACTMENLALAIGKDYNVIGIRHGEKMHESLISQEEMYRTEDMGGFYRVKADSRNMNYSDYYTDGKKITELKAYTSENTTRLNVTQIKELLDATR